MQEPILLRDRMENYVFSVTCLMDYPLFFRIYFFHYVECRKINADPIITKFHMLVANLRINVIKRSTGNLEVSGPPETVG